MMTHQIKVLCSMILLLGCLVLMVTAASDADTTNSNSDSSLDKLRTPPHRQRPHYYKHHHTHGQHQHQHTHHQHHHQHQHQHHQKKQRRLERLQDEKQQQQQLKADVELLPGATMPPRKNNTSSSSSSSSPTSSSASHSTRLRRIYSRLQPRNLGSSSVQRPSEWDYNTYNIYTNTYGPPPPSAAARPSGSDGKGEDNMDDVEFIGASSGSKSVGRGYDYATPQPPPPPQTNFNRRAVPSFGTVPPLVPARRGYVTSAPPARRSDNDLPTMSTENPFETNTINRNYPTDGKDMERRHICVQQRTITMPVKTTEVYTRPIWKHFSTPCQPPTHANQMCTRVQLVHEQAYRDVIRHKSAQQVTYECCTGWTRETPHAEGCMKPVCAARCQNGGTCSGPDMCTCPVGFTGRHCEQDINECKEEKPCDQTCVNTVGSYFCKCREGFVLQSDQQSCKKIDTRGDDAFEARDLENDIDAGDSEMTSRLQKIERSLANERVHTHELQKSLQVTHNVVDTLKTRLVTLEKQQLDFNRLQTNLYKTETRTNKLEGMLNLLMKCRNGPNANCP